MLDLSGNNAFFAKTGIDLGAAQQGSKTWMDTKLGVLSASHAKEILAGQDTDTRHTYMCSLVAQVCTRNFPEVNSYHLEWGKSNEGKARACFEFATGHVVEEMSFIFKDESLRVGISADGFLQDQAIGMELKCPSNTENYIKFLVADKIKPEWQMQMQMSMWVTGLSTWIFANYDPRMSVKPLHYIEVHRNPSTMARFDDCVPEFIHDYDRLLEKVGVEYGSQWGGL